MCYGLRIKSYSVTVTKAAYIESSYFAQIPIKIT